MNDAGDPFPGSGLTVAQMIGLADEYCTAAYVLIAQEDPTKLTTFAPTRLCVIHAMELYLSAFLIFHGTTPQDVRALGYSLAGRADIACGKGLKLQAKTIKNLAELGDSREYLLVRYAPDKRRNFMQLPRLFSTLQDITRKVRSAVFEQPYPQDDPRFRKYW